MTTPNRKHDTELKEQTKVQKPKMYRVVILNDDYTTMEFVVYVLQAVFQKSAEEAAALMYQIHEQGKGVAGVYTYEISEMKAMTVIEMARQNEYPLQAILEAE